MQNRFEKKDSKKQLMHSIENFTPTNEKHVYSRTNATSSHKIARNNNKTFVD